MKPPWPHRRGWEPAGQTATPRPTPGSLRRGWASRAPCPIRGLGGGGCSGLQGFSPSWVLEGGVGSCLSSLGDGDAEDPAGHYREGDLMRRKSHRKGPSAGVGPCH